jgi:hypothetical protein
VGEATLSRSDLAVGGHSITVEYAGDGRYAGSGAAAVGHAVTARPATPQATPTPAPVAPAADAPVLTTRLAISHRTTPRAGSYVKLAIHCRGAQGTRCKGVLTVDPTGDSTRLAAAGR